MNHRAGVLALAATLACQASTTRPEFGPLPAAPGVVLQVDVPRATGLLAERLRADSFPLEQVEPRDGYLVTTWFDTTTFRIARSRPLGQDIVRVRAWVDPERPGSSRITVETIYRDIADPSLPERELDREVPPEHPVSTRVRAVLDSLRSRYGQPDRSG